MTPEERAARRIGGSTIAKILSKSKWGTPLDAYLELIGERQEEKSGEDIDRGNFLEPALRDWTNKKLGTHFIKGPMLTYPGWDWATVSPDGLNDLSLLGGRQAPGTLLEIKAPRRDDAGQWGEELTDEIPTDPLLQTHWGMLVANASDGVVAALLGGELRIYRVKRDPELESKMLARAKEFVEQHVIPRIPPPAQWGDDKNVLYLHPRDTKPRREWADLTEQERVVVGEYLTTWKERKDAERREEEWQPIIKELIADTAGISLPAGRIDFKKNASGGTKWKQLAEHLMSLGNGASGRRWADEEIEALKRQFAGEPPRVLTPRLTQDKEKSR